MKSVMAALLAVALVGCGTERSAEDSAPKRLKVLTIGNSFSICLMSQMPACVKSTGRELDLCSLFIGGCSLERHWRNVVASTNAGFRPYSISWNYCGKSNDPAAPVARAVVDNHANIPEVLSADRWDVVTLQQASHFSWRPETYEPYGGNLIDLIRRLAPQAEIVVQETWSYTPYDGRLKKWGITPDEMYANLKLAYAGFASTYGLRIIPTGTAVQDFRRAMPSPDGITGDPCGSPTGKDKFHLNSEGHYLQACTWYAALYRRSAADITYRPRFLTAERAEQMRRSADVACGTGK